MENQALPNPLPEVAVLAKAMGPIVVSADVAVTKPDGTIDHRTGKTSFCGCGHSKNKPYCDGTHKTIGQENLAG